MVEGLSKIEIERIVNLAVSLGWAKTEERIENGFVVVVLRKSLPAEPEAPAT